MATSSGYRKKFAWYPMKHWYGWIWLKYYWERKLIWKYTGPMGIALEAMSGQSDFDRAEELQSKAQSVVISERKKEKEFDKKWRRERNQKLIARGL